CPTKNDPAALATGSSNLALLVTPSDTSNGTLTERHYRDKRGFFSCRHGDQATALMRVLLS
ncbi:hypothetical protein ACQUK4_23195, partial [Ralstonia pseudosolanacearum]